MPSIAALALTLAAIGTPAPDYTPIDAWMADWEQRITVTGPTVALIDELEAIRLVIDGPPEPVTVAAPKITAPAYPVPAGEMVERWRSLVEAHFQPEDVAWAMRVIACESGGNPNAANPTSSARGLMQFLKGWYSGAWGGTGAFDPYDPEANVTAGAWLFYNGGASHWNASRGCWG